MFFTINPDERRVLELVGQSAREMGVPAYVVGGSATMGLDLLESCRAPCSCGRLRRGCHACVTCPAMQVVVDLHSADERPSAILDASERSLREQIVDAVPLASQILGGLWDGHIGRCRVAVCGRVALGDEFGRAMRDLFHKGRRQLDRERPVGHAGSCLA